MMTKVFEETVILINVSCGESAQGGTSNYCFIYPQLIKWHLEFSPFLRVVCEDNYVLSHDLENSENSYFNER